MILINNHKRIMIGFLFLLLFSNMAFASNTLNNCTNNMTLQKNNSIYYNNTWYNFTENINCDYGCEHDSCNLDPIWYYLLFAIIIIIVAIIIYKWLA